MSSDTPSDTPRTTSFLSSPRGLGTGYYQAIDFARQLERELSAARSDLECQGQAYSKALDDLAAANKRLEEARTVLDKSEKWLKRLRSCLPSHGSFGESGRDDHESVISSIEKAIAAIDGKEGGS